MNRDIVMESARAIGLVVEPCVADSFIAIRGDKTTNTNERMRMTADGALLTNYDGYWWQIGTIEDVDNYVKEKQQ